MPVIVKKDCPNTDQMQRRVAEIVVDAYWEEVALLCDDKEKMAEALCGCFHLEHFYLGYEGDNAVGLAACCPPGHRALTVATSRFRRVLGPELGTMASQIMKSEFESPLDFGPDSAYIEFVATATSAQGKGVATQVTQAILETAPYPRFVLEVADTNVAAIRIYEKFGFVEFQRRKENTPPTPSTLYRIYMEYIRGKEKGSG